MCSDRRDSGVERDTSAQRAPLGSPLQLAGRSPVGSGAGLCVSPLPHRYLKRGISVGITLSEPLDAAISAEHAATAAERVATRAVGARRLASAPASVRPSCARCARCGPCRGAPPGADDTPAPKRFWWCTACYVRRPYWRARSRDARSHIGAPAADGTPMGATAGPGCHVRGC